MGKILAINSCHDCYHWSGIKSRTCDGPFEKDWRYNQAAKADNYYTGIELSLPDWCPLDDEELLRDI